VKSRNGVPRNPVERCQSRASISIGKSADDKRYDDVVQNIRTAFRKAYIKDHGEVGTGTQTSYVVALYTKIYGKIISDWKGTDAGPFSLSVTVPANTSAKVFLPAIAGAQLTEDGNPVDAQPERGSYVVTVGSGSYKFDVK